MFRIFQYAKKASRLTRIKCMTSEKQIVRIK